MADAGADPLLQPWSGPLGAPDFAAIRAEHFLPAFDVALAESRNDIAAITANPAPPTFDNSVLALERSGATLARVRRLFWALSSVQSTDSIRAIEGEVSARLTAHSTEISHDAALFERIRAVWAEREKLPPEAARLTDNSYKGFVAGGASLAGDAKRRFAAIDDRLSALSVQFGQNVLAATNAAEVILDRSELAGIPADFVAGAERRATERGLADRFVFVLDRGVYEALLGFAEVRAVRERVWRTFGERCRGGRFDNLAIIAEIVALRQEKAGLLGYASYADYALEDSMAGTPDTAEGLMNRVWPAGLAKARVERAELQALIDSGGGGFALDAWDWRYFAERLRRERFSYDAARIREHLTLDKVRSAAFDAASRLYGLTFARCADAPVYHPDVSVWSVSDSDGAAVGLIYTDYLARPEKHGGAWMGSLRVQEKMDGAIKPIVYTVANFTCSGSSHGQTESAALLSLDEARTLFHEFGHALHALLSDVCYPSLAGTAVSRDFVEFPSKLMEHWIAEPEALAKLGVPDDLVAAIGRASTYGQGFATVEFLASAMVDMALHRVLPPPTDIAGFETDTLAKLGIPSAIGPRHRLSVFTHVFDGGYASAYYSYLWSEVLDADVSKRSSPSATSTIATSPADFGARCSRPAIRAIR